MFCSNCGKSIRPEDATCPHCGAVLGEDRFLGNMYTSSQVRVPADALDTAPAGSLSAYTRTDYMSYDNQPEDDVYSNTTYRPVLNDEEDLTRQEQEAEDAAEPVEPEEAEAEAAEAPADDEASGFESEDTAEPEEAPSEPAEEPEPAEEAAEDILAEDDEDDEESVSPLPELSPRGISPAVQRYMREAEERHQGKPKHSGGLKLSLPFLKKKQAKPEPEYEEEPAEDIPGAQAAETTDSAEPAYEEAPAEEAAYEEEAVSEETVSEEIVSEEAPAEGTVDLSEDDYEPEDTDGEYEPEGDTAEAAPAAEDESYEEEEGEDGERRAPFKFDLSALKSNRTLQIAIAAVLVLLVLIGGIRWLLYVTSSLGTKIAGVTHSTYSEGIKLINEYATDEYRDNLVKTGSVNMDYAQTQMNADMAKLNGLMPAEPQENDELFVTTLTILHEGIQNVIKADASAAYNGRSEARAAASQQEWAAVKNAVAQLNEATSVTQLSALAGDIQAAVIPTPTPAPTPVVTPAPTPMVLTQGMKDNAEVKKMQERLIQLGYLTGKADGDFGPKTGAALQAFQTAAGLSSTGIATEEVLDALYADTAPAATTEGTVTGEGNTHKTIEV